jgi:ATP-binding cassette subfamily B protein
MENTEYTLFQFIKKMVRPFPFQIIGITFTACYWAIDLSLQPYFIKLILDAASEQPTVKSVIIPVCLYILAAFLFTLSFRLHDFVRLKFYPKLRANLTAYATDKVSKQSYSFFQSQFSGSLANKIKDLNRGIEEIIQIFFDRFLSNFLALLIACLMLLTVQPVLSFVLLMWTCLLLGSSFLFTRKARKLSHEFSQTSSHTVGAVVDIFTNMLNVRLFAAQKAENQRLKSQLKTNLHADQALRKYLFLVNLVQGLSTAIMIGICLIIMTYSLESYSITVGDFGLVLTLLVSIANTIWNLADEFSRFSENYGLVSQALSILNAKQEIKDSPNAGKLRVTQGEIRFESIYFHYREKGPDPLFNNKSIVLKPGEKIGLVGYSGSGKTTFVQLILRLFDVQSGKIFIDNQSITDVTQDSLHEAIGMIPQDPTLFNRTLMENIRFGKPNATDEEILQAAYKAHAHAFIRRLPEGYDTVVGERGIKISGGQRQRIAIARAILKNAPILILDEATSALDSMTEAKIQSSLHDLMQDKTTLVIAHRLSTLLNMDRILVFERGRIIEDGQHDELLVIHNGVYKKLWGAQVGGFLPDKKKK